MFRKFSVSLACIALTAMSLASTMFAAGAAAQQPEPWQIGLQAAGSEGMGNISSLHNLLLAVITLICLFVLVLLILVTIKFNERSHPTPSRTTHNTLIEVIWTVIPALILVVIAVPSFRLLYAQESLPEADITIKAIGKQWYWTYEYPDHGNFTFDALMLADARALELGEPRLLGTTNRIVVPVNATVRLLITSADVIHAWAMPAFGVKMDAVPGRITQTGFRANAEGVYYGQCSELCGSRHAFMPIGVEVVSRQRFDEWIAEAQVNFAGDGAPRRQFAASAEHGAR